MKTNAHYTNRKNQAKAVVLSEPFTITGPFLMLSSISLLVLLVVLIISTSTGMT